MKDKERFGQLWLQLKLVIKWLTIYQNRWDFYHMIQKYNCGDYHNKENKYKWLKKDNWNDILFLVNQMFLIVHLLQIVKENLHLSQIFCNNNKRKVFAILKHENLSIKISH